MSEAHLRFSTSILSRLGEELNPNIDQGLIELVKNAYDADARECTIELIRTDDVGGEFRITDDGIGMDRDAIEDGWLVLGQSRKSSRDRTPKFGRLPAGNKGLGRLAALRMGSIADLIARPEQDPELEYSVKLNWDEFVPFEVVENVPLQVIQRKRAPNTKPGTTISIRNLRSRITRADVARLARGMLLLADPFDDNPTGFRPVLKASEFKDLERLVQRRYFDEAEFHLSAELDECGRARAQVTDWKGAPLHSAKHADLSPRKPEGRYACPPATFDLYAFVLDSTTFTQHPRVTLSEVREWLGKFGGVHLYIRGLRVAPYGDSGNDWLDMNLSRAKSPEARFSTNTSIGRLATADVDEVFLQKTDRSGIADGEAFFELRRFATDALNWMAKRRLEERDKRLAKEKEETSRKVRHSKKNVEEVIQSLSSQQQQDMKASFAAYDRERDRETATLRKDVQLYRTMSTAGIIASVFAHETKRPLSLILSDTATVLRLIQQQSSKKSRAAVERRISGIAKHARALDALVSLNLRLVDSEKRRTSRVDLHATIEGIVAMLAPFVKERGITLEQELDQGKPYLRGSEAAIESILMNLVSNSLRAFEEILPGERKLVIRTEISQAWLTLRVLDNGPGIRGVSVKDIWLPGETTYPNGTGLGLAIVRDTTLDLGGKVDAVKKGALGGAEIVVELPILGA
jgi:signal transduction histidine kinase